MKRLASLKNHSSPSTPARAASSPTQSPYSPYYPYKAGKPSDGSPPPSSSSAAPSHDSFSTSHHHHHNHSLNSLSSSTVSSPNTATPSQKSRRPPPSATTTTTTATASTFSSPAPSMRSLTTTLTTVQSTAPGSLLDPYPHYNPHPSHHHNPNAPPMLFQHQFPSTPHPNAPTSPGPTLLTASTLHPLNYSTATAGGLLTDNASIITLASSSKRRRRHSLDTDASVRALAPSSLWGGSRESLPLSVLSSNFERATATTARRSVACETDDDDNNTIDHRRRSMSVCGDGDGQSMREGSSNVGVWHGVFGSREREAKRGVA